MPSAPNKTCGCGCAPHRCRCKPGCPPPCGRGGGGGQGTGGQGGDGGTNGPPWTAQPEGSWLLIRYDTADTGVRPIPSGDTWWLSPDVWVTGGDGSGNPIGGQPCVVNARIWNLGTTNALPTSVQFTYIEPFLAIPITIPQPINPVPVYTLVPGGGHVDVSVPWTPPAASGDVHACLIVTCSCAMTGDVPTTPGNAVADRHTAQRNVTLLGPSTGKTIRFNLALANLRPAAATVVLGARALWITPPKGSQTRFRPFDPLAVSGSIRMLDRPATQLGYQLLSRRAAMLLDRSDVITSTELSTDAVESVVQVSRVTPGHTLPAGTIVPPRGRVDGTTDAITPIASAIQLKPLQRATAHFEIQVPGSSPQGQYFVVHLFQMTDGAVEGGYSLVFGAPHSSQERSASRAASLDRAIEPGRSIATHQQRGGIPMSVKQSSDSSEHELLLSIVEEVDEAREVHELAQQLVHALPLASFEELVKAVGPKGTINFRGSPHAVANFADVVPEVLFPIDTVPKLVALLAATVRLAPATLRYSDRDEKYARIKLRRLGILGVQGSIGVLGRIARKNVPSPKGG